MALTLCSVLTQFKKCMETQITYLAIVTVSGVKTYTLGDMINGKALNKIRLAELHFTGDPFDHYCGYDKDGEMLFSVNCLVPCEVVYNTK
jgi:hypothetical protein